MATQVYECQKDGEFEITQSMSAEVKKNLPCPVCSEESPHKLVPCAGIKVVRGWNEQANEYQRDAYTMGKAQVINNYNEKRDEGIYLPKPNEKDFQIAAQACATDKGPQELKPYIPPSLKKKNKNKTK